MVYNSSISGNCFFKPAQITSQMHYREEGKQGRAKPKNLKAKKVLPLFLNVFTKTKGITRKILLFFKLFQACKISFSSLSASCLVFHVQFLSLESLFVAVLVKLARKVTLRETNIVFTAHARDAEQSKSDLCLFLDYSDVIVCASLTIKQRLHGLDGNCRLVTKYVTSENVINALSSYKTSSFVYSSLPIKLISVGRLVPKKGFRRIPLIARYLKESGLLFEWNIVGDGPEGTYLKHLITSLDLEKNICMTGILEQKQISNLYKSSDFYVGLFTREGSDIDGLPTVLIEAAAHKLPIVTTQVANIKDLFDSTNSTILNSALSDQQVANVIINEFQNYSRLQSKANLAYSLAKEKSSFAAQKTSLEQIYYG